MVEDVLDAPAEVAPVPLPPDPPSVVQPSIVHVTADEVADDDIVVVARAAVPASSSKPSTPRHAGYVRPDHRAPEAGVSEADTVERDLTAKPAPALGNGRSRTLLRRLKDIDTPDRFEADGYAAYRGSVEEASVTIIGAADADRPARMPAPATDTNDAITAPASRFLKALTGNIKR